ncbi:MULTISPECIES: phage tail tape measure protein [unclassified Yoonia]|uniref:phage tail tape measure protein n=1 Tax=unclassified Yoonia TaxID=2629118 RepID=UPI002AFE2260|nr:MULTISPECIES: phage tail tape measure protein [unclassified Yoonia]
MAEQKLVLRLSSAGLGTVRSALRSVSSGISNVNRSLRIVASAGRTAGRAVSSINTGMKAVARQSSIAALGIAGVATAFSAVTRSGVDSVAETGRFARSVGLTVEQYTALRFAAQQAGMDVDGLNGFLINLADKGFDAFNGNVGSAEQLADLGVSAVDAEGNLRPLFDLFLDLADSVASMEDGTKKTGALSIFAGDDGARSIDLLNQGSEGIERQIVAAKDLGLVVTEAQADLAQSTRNSIEGLFATIRATRDEVALVFAPDLARGSDALAAALSNNREEIVRFSEAGAEKVRDLISDLYAVFSGKGQPKSDFLARNAQNIRDIVSALTGNTAAIQNPNILAARADLIGFGEAAFEAMRAVGRAYLYLKDVYSDFKAIMSGEGSIDTQFMKDNAQNISDIMSAIRGDREAIENGAIKAAYDILVGLGNTAVVVALVLADMFNTIAGNTDAQMFTDFGKIFNGMYTNFIKPTKDLIENAVLGLVWLFEQALGEGGAAWFAVGGLIFILTQFNNIVGLIQTTVASLGAIKAFFALISSTAAFASFTANLAAFWASISAFGAGVAAVFTLPIIIGIGAVIVALVALWYFWDDIVEIFWWAMGQISGGLAIAADIWNNFWTGASEGFNRRLQNITDRWNNFWGSIWGKDEDEESFDWIDTELSESMNTAIANATELWEGFQNTLVGRSLMNLGAYFGLVDSPQPTVSRSAGGMIQGAGSGTSDSILARVSNGEYVVRAAAVRKFGRGLLDNINNGFLPAFATGGLVGMPSPILAGSFDSSGMSGGGGRPVMLNMPDGSRVNLRGDSDVVGKLEKSLRKSSTSSTTRNPGWYK